MASQLVRSVSGVLSSTRFCPPYDDLRGSMSPGRRAPVIALQTKGARLETLVDMLDILYIAHDGDESVSAVVWVRSFATSIEGRMKA